MDASLDSTDLPLFWLVSEQKRHVAHFAAWSISPRDRTWTPSAVLFSSSPTQFDAERLARVGSSNYSAHAQTAMRVVERPTRKDDSTSYV